MWIFTRYGFFSAVCARQGNGSRGQAVDPDRIMVRARVREHLEAMKRQFPSLLGGCEIQVSAGTDYRYRIFVDKPVWSRALAALAEDTDYDNFKSEVATLETVVGKAYSESLHDVWHVMSRLQKLAAAAKARNEPLRWMAHR